MPPLSKPDITGFNSETIGVWMDQPIDPELQLTRTERGRQLRRAVNFAIKDDGVDYEKLKDGSWRATVYYRETTSHSDEETFGWTVYVSEFSVDFRPGELEYHDGPVRNIDEVWPVDFKTYAWAVRKLANYQVHQKLRENLDDE